MTRFALEQAPAPPSILYDDGGEERVIFTLPPANSPDLDSVLYFTLPKAGTVMMSRLVTRLASRMGLRRVYIEGEFFKLGIRSDQAPSSTSDIFLDKGYCYGSPFLPTRYEIPILGKAKAITLVRDPRDMLVSLYYSVRESHPTPGESSKIINSGRAMAAQMQLDDHVLQNAPRYREMLRDYRQLAQSPLTKVFRYEDAVYDKLKWAKDICDFFGWEVPERIQQRIASELDVFPDKERPDQHVRQVHPGNFKKKLKFETIRKLDEIFAEEMEFFGYKPYSPASLEPVEDRLDMTHPAVEPSQSLPYVVYNDGGEERVIYTLPPTKRPDLESVLAFTMHKSGNVMLTTLMAHLARSIGMTAVNIEGEYFQLGLRESEMPASTSEIFVDKGYCYVGFPYFPTQYVIPIFGKVKSILLIRDPRDMLVSLYYSLLYSHPLPSKPLKTGYRTLPGRESMKAMDVDDFVLAAHGPHAERMKRYRQVVQSNPMLKVYRYEDIVYDKMSWVADICAHFGWDIPAERQREIVAKVDVFPKKEQKESHVRQVHPGNYKKKLKPETIRKLDEIFAEEMAFFGYEPFAPSLWERLKARS